MRRLIIIISFLFTSPIIASDISRLSWLSGCWASANFEAGSGEMWMAPAGGSLLGVSRTVKKGKTVAHEFMQIRDVDGRIYFIANPSGQNEARFLLAKLEGTRAIFENLDHDFPQRILYALNEDGSLVGRIEGNVNGTEKAIDYPMARATCP
ncbi:MAG TPA: DUF6265 family protein [Thermoanaerobaculia bacterium]